MSARTRFASPLSQHLAFFACAAMWLLSGQAPAQGLLVNVTPDQRVRLPRPTIHPNPTPTAGSYKIESIDVNVQLNDQIARIQLSQSFVNTGNQQMEVSFVFPLPYDGAIDRLTLMVDGKEYEARLLPADEARKTYEDIVRKNRDPALLEWIGTGMFRTSVFPVPAGAKRTVTLRYSQVCRKSQGLTDFLFPLKSAKYSSQALEKLNIRIAIESSEPIKNIYSATHAVTIDRPDDRHAVVTHTATNQLPSDDFHLFYDANTSGIGASVISYRPEGTKDGYFLLLASPELKKADVVPAAKTVVFVVDRSGSMNGEKIEQAKGALKYVLNNLRAGDLFNIVAYDSEIETFRPELQRFDDQTREAALGFVEGIFSGGSTDINAALGRAMGMLRNSSRPTYVIFLTDGLPTAGKTNEAAIASNCQQANHVRARLFVFGVGYDVNSRLLDKLAHNNFGESEYVRPNENIEAAISKLYARIEAPVMTDVTVEIFSTSVKPVEARLSRVYPKGAFDLFAGNQTIIVGRYSNPGRKNMVRLKGFVAGEQRTLEFPADLAGKSEDDTNSFVAKLWAMRRVGEIIDQIDLNGQNEELIKELVALATEHGILTPYTSFLADETSDIHDVAANRDFASKSLRELDNVSGAEGVAQRRMKGAYKKVASASASGGGYGGAVPALEAEEIGKLQANRGRGTVFYDYRKDKQVAVTTVHSQGRKTFFQREGRWVDASCTDDEIKQAQKIDRYSREYFDLIAQHGKHVAQYLAMDEPVVIKFGDQIYAW